MGPESLELALSKREELIKLSKEDPLRHGIELREWGRARQLLEEYTELLLMGGARASKSEFAAKWMTELGVNSPGKSLAFLHSSERSSINQQQRYVYRMLPPEWRDIGKVGRTTNVTFTVKNGFSANTFILPNGSQALFFNYLQPLKVLEGYEFDAVWCDELVPMEFIETLRFRLVTRRGKLLLTFTPVEGYSLTVKSYVAGARTLVSRPAPLLDPEKKHVRDCPPGHMPVAQQCTRKSAAVMYLFSEDNVFNPYDELLKTLDGATAAQIMIRAYGYATRMEQVTFPKFQRKVNVIPRGEVPREGTRYVIVDPGGSKNWFILWVIVDFLDRAVVYREWPDRGRYGEWAVASDKPAFNPGPAQRLEAGRGITAYKELMLELEGWERDAQQQFGDYPGFSHAHGRGMPEAIHLRLMDPRMGGATVLGADEGTSIIELMAEEHVDKDLNVDGPCMIFHPADSGRLISEGVGLVNDRLDYREQEPITSLNQPRLFVSEDCENTIFSIEEWIEGSGEKCGAKDPIDCLRYFVKSDCRYIDPEEETTAQRGGHF